MTKAVLCIEVSGCPHWRVLVYGRVCYNMHLFSMSCSEVTVEPDSLAAGRKLGALCEEESSADHSTRSPSPAATSSNTSSKKHVRRTGRYRMSQVIKLEYDLSHPMYSEIKQIILERVLSWLQPEKEAVVYTGPLKSPLPSPSLTPTSPLPPKSSSFLPSGVDLICEMWFTSRDNVNLLCEICRHSFLVSLVETRLMYRVIELYWSWVSMPVSQPLFMTQPLATAPVDRAEGQASRNPHLTVPHDPGAMYMYIYMGDFI